MNHGRQTTLFLIIYLILLIFLGPVFYLGIWRNLYPRNNTDQP
jgi:hypothetical protein